MIKKTVTYRDYDEHERTEDFYFNISKAELADLELLTPGGFSSLVSKAYDAKDLPTLIRIFQQILKLSYGEKTADGRRFVKSDEVWNNFAQTEAYSVLYMEFATDADKAAAFINGILPKMDDNITPVPVSGSTN